MHRRRRARETVTRAAAREAGVGVARCRRRSRRAPAQFCSTTVSRSGIRLMQRFDSSANGLVRRWSLTGPFPYPIRPPSNASRRRRRSSGGEATRWVWRSDASPARRARGAQGRYSDAKSGES
jgi:hypothetical protein